MNRTLTITAISVVGLAIIYFGLNKYYFGTFLMPGKDNITLLGPNGVQVTIKNGRYQNYYYRFSFNIPEEWKKDIDIQQTEIPYLLEDGKTAVAFQMADEKYSFQILVNSTYTPKEYSDQLYSEADMKSQTEYINSTGGHVLDAKVIKLNENGYLARFLKIRGNDAGYDGASMHYQFQILYHTTLYSILASAAEKDMAEFNPQFYKVIESIKFTD